MFFLSATICLQFLIIIIVKTSIPIPEYFAQRALAESDLDSYIINNAEIFEGSKLGFEKLSVSSNRIKANLQDAVISFRPNFTSLNWANSISQCEIDNLHISTNEFNMEFENIIFKLVNDFYQLECSLNWRSKFVQMTILFLDFQEILSESGGKVDLNKLVEGLSNNLVLFDQYFSDDLIEVYSTIKKGVINITGTSKSRSKSLKNNHVFHACINKLGNGARNFRGKVKSYSNTANIHHFSIGSGEAAIAFDFDLLSQSEFSLNQINHLSISGIELDGPISGNLPEIKVSFYEKNEKKFAHFYGDSNMTDFSLFAELPLSSKWEGFLNLHPTNSNLSAKMAYGKTAIFDGEILKLSCRPNLVPFNDSSPTLFNIHASSFSVLDTKPGLFSFNGEIDSNMSIFINNAYGRFGGSEATGSYIQHWNPPRYRFLLDGHCLPTDLSPWLGAWWNDIWQDFTFSGKSPAGNFSISGIWGGSSGNSFTHGFVESGDIEYKKVQFSDSNVEIVVQNSYTNILFKPLKHKFGEILGKLTFSPRAIPQPYLEFDGYGEFPFNAGKSIFDSGLDGLVDEINASVVSFDGEGFINLAKGVDVADYNSTSFSVYLDSDRPIQVKGVPVASFSGEIGRRDGLLHCDFENLILAEGTCTIQIKEKSAISDLIELRLNISDARPDLLYSTVYQNWLSENEGSDGPLFIPGPKSSISEFDQKGTVSINLLGVGPVSDPLQLQGTGNFLLKGIDVGRIDFLGGLRKNLGTFNLPMPSDALRFNTLEAPFQIDQGNLTFDNFQLKGPLSKIVGKGTFDLTNSTVDLSADLKLMGNIQVPIVSQVLSFADPFSRLSEIHVHGPVGKPSWEILVTPVPLPK